jgi:hypothetical protein
MYMNDKKCLWRNKIILFCKKWKKMWLDELASKVFKENVEQLTNFNNNFCRGKNALRRQIVNCFWKLLRLKLLTLEISTEKFTF